MKKKLLALISKVVYRNLRIHKDSDGSPTGFSMVGVDVASFDSAPFEEILQSSGLGWTLSIFESKQATIVNQSEPTGARMLAFNPDGTPRMLLPSVYIGKSGDSINDLSNALDSLI